MTHQRWSISNLGLIVRASTTVSLRLVLMVMDKLRVFISLTGIFIIYDYLR